MAQSHSSPTRPATLVEGLEGVSAGIALVAGQRLGPYRLIKALGEGGMGVVWLADQVEPFERKVAIKLSNQKLSSGLSQAYFEVERQAMATMVHPYIAQIYDAGALPNGALYFAMEYVSGGALDDYVSNNKPSLDNCAALLALVCQGVQYAHQRGLIHRDLKPANILIADIAGKPMPKIIDFGIAIGVDSARAVGVGGSAGTRAYMAPEQINPNTDGIDVRADVYALGAILVETLCLTLNISLERLDSNSLRSLLSAAAYTTDGKGEHVPAPATLRSQINRIPKPLRAISLKAMANDRNQRYESAAAFADDLNRWRERRPVLAMRGGRMYAVRCFINRFRGASALGFLTLVSLVAGLVVAAYGLNQAQHARALAETRREQAEKLVGYMLGDFAAKLAEVGKLDLIDDVAKQALAYLSQANDTDARSAIQRAAALRTIGDVQTQLGQWAKARQTFVLAEKALDFAESAEPGTADLLYERAQEAYWLGLCFYNERKFDATTVQWARYLDYAKRLQPLTGVEGTGLLETSYALNNLGTVAFEIGDLDAASQYFSKTIAIGRELLLKYPNDDGKAFDLASAISWEAKTQEAKGDLIGATASYNSLLTMWADIISARPDAVTYRFEAANARQWLALMALQTGKIELAKTQLNATVVELSKLHQFEPNQRQWQGTLATARSNLAWVFFAQREFDAAEKELEIASLLFESPNGEAVLTDWIRGAAIVLYRSAQIATAKNQFARAAALNDRAIGILQALILADANDRKSAIALAHALLSKNVEAATRRAQSLLVTVSAKQRDAEVFDPMVRAHILLREFDAAHTLQLQLNAMGYQHPNYRAFLALHPTGATP